MSDQVLQQLASQALVAGAPQIDAILAAAETMVTTTMTGDPATLLLRGQAAAEIFVGQVKLQLIPLLGAEIGALGTTAISDIGTLRAKLQAAVAAAAAAKSSSSSNSSTTAAATA